MTLEVPLTVPVSVNCAWTLDRYEKLPVRAFMPFTQFNGYPGCSYKIGYTLFDPSGKRVRINPNEHETVKEKVLRYFSDLPTEMFHSETDRDDCTGTVYLKTGVGAGQRQAARSPRD